MGFYEQLPLSSEKPCFRLLRIHEAGGSDDALRGDAATYDLKSPCDVEYDALSYCWGAAAGTDEIQLNGETITISANLAAALRQFREDKHRRLLWVDAVCINQGDKSEKSHQVMLMTQIYANAARVFSWIGNPDDHAVLAFDTLRRFAADDGTQDASATARELAGEAEARRTAVRNLVRREYFFRMWIVQEVVAARTVVLVCGPHIVDFDTACAGLQRATGSGYCPFSPEAVNLVYVSHWRDAYHGRDPSGGGDGEDLDLRLFLDTRDRSATDPRDKIYALRGIARPRITQGIKVDYHDPVEKVYTDFTRLVLRVRPDLQILSAVMVRHASRSRHELPSYVPDWTQPKYGGGFLQRYYRFKPTHLFKASGQTTPAVSAVDGGDGISVEGFRLDTVSRVIDIKSLLTGGGGPAGRRTLVTKPVLSELAADAVPSGTYPFTGEPAWLAYFRTLTADRSALSPRIADSYRSVNFAQFSDVDLKHPDRIPENLPGSLWDEISKAVETIVEDKVLFLTAEGYLGLGQEGCAVGDVVCVFLGGEVPFLARAEDGGSIGGFRFLGECYVHGVMDGEAMDGNRPFERFLLV